MRFGSGRGTKTGNWTASEQAIADDMNFLSEASYLNLGDLFASLVVEGPVTSASAAIASNGVQLLWSAALTCILKAGMLIGFDGTYFNTDAFTFVATANGDNYLVAIPADQSIAFASGSPTGDRYDIVEVKPTQVQYNNEIRSFKDPSSGLVVSSNTNTRTEYGFSFLVKQGTAGSGVAPLHDAGYVKIAEILVPQSASAISQSNIKDIRDSASWTTEAGITTYCSSRYATNTDIVDARGIFTSTNLESALQELDPMKIGCMMAFDGAAWSDNVTMPGWYACISGNSGHGCADLTSRFLMGQPTTGFVKGTNYGVSGGSNSHTIASAELPLHTHDMGNHTHGVSGGTGAAGGHSHNLSLGSAGTSTGTQYALGSSSQMSLYITSGMTPQVGPINVGSTHTSWRSLDTSTQWLYMYDNTNDLGYVINTTYENSHTHGISLTSGNPSVNTTGNGGFTNTSIDIRPQWYSVIWIRKCA